MAIQIFNVLSGNKEPFEPVVEGRAGIYVCGVTVYGRCHVGHLRCYLSFDAIVRYLHWRGFDVRYVRNFTDIDDKIIARAQEIAAGPQGEWRTGPAYATYDEAQWAERLAEDAVIAERAKGDPRHLAEVVADHFIDVFAKEDFAPFDLFPAASEPRVSMHIPEVIALIEKIMAAGFAYASAGDVYFDVPAYHSATGRYGVLSRRDFTQMMEGARVAPGEKKRSARDFALWKSAQPGEPFWESPFGPGRPGWHIECSAMSEKELGIPFDIHGGGKDLIFPHHENEIAQSEAASGKRFCNVWMHNGFVTVDGVKMSKSLGNFISISKALELAPPEVWRMLVLSSHYASPIDFSRTREGAEGDCVRGSIDIAFDRLEYFYETLRRAQEAVGDEPVGEDTPKMDDSRLSGVVEAFTEAMDDDFNTARALAGIGEAMKALNELCDMKAKQQKALKGGREAWRRTIRDLAASLKEVCGVLHICRDDPATALCRMRDDCARAYNIDCNAVRARLEERRRAREAKDWARSDQLRDELLAMKVALRDGPSGTEWKVLRT